MLPTDYEITQRTDYVGLKLDCKSDVQGKAITTAARPGPSMVSTVDTPQEFDVVIGAYILPKHSKKGLKKMQANSAKVMSMCAEAILALVEPKKLKPKMPKRPNSKLHQLAFADYPKLGK
ncbi:hypothetical protein A6R68_11756 [Neotoma lepida]|uniref:Uncharacterized protein n=1 Tax=Neotoma lepida TaxID=56216 RepID=A0A1A6FU59_NEOLE|nr:hypothetical protein A6R68_11756 [Neotoma lepida]